MTDLTLHPGERILVSLRKHPLIAVGTLLPYAILDYLPYLLPKFGAWLTLQNPTSTFNYMAAFSFANPWIDFIVGIYWLFVWMGAFSTFTNYFLDEWIVTNERVIDVNQKSFWSREVSSLFLDRVQDVDVDITGFFQTLFGFGTVTVESAGAEPGIVHMTGLARPTYVRNLILEEVGKLHKQIPVNPITGGV
jgi:hypothetical protein